MRAKKFNLLEFFPMYGVLLLGLAACSGPTGPSTLEVTVSGIGWAIENIDPSYWSPAPDRSAYINFWIGFEENNLAAADIASVVITAPTGRIWKYDDPATIAENFNPESDIFGGWNRLYSTFYTSNASVLPIGLYAFEVTLRNGNSDSVTRTIPAPGSTGTDSMSYVYSEDYAAASTPPQGYTPLPLRASIGSAVLAGGSSFTVRFSVADSLVYSGYIWLYDASEGFIGMPAADFRDYTSGEISSTLNAGAAFYTDGTQNVLEMAAADIEFQDGCSFQDLYAIHLVLTDGRQYEFSTSSYDTRSISEWFTVTIE